MQWIVWIPRVLTMASVWTGSATASQAGGASTVSCPGPSAQNNAMVTAPLFQRLGCAAAIPTGWDPTVPWVSLGSSPVQLSYTRHCKQKQHQRTNMADLVKYNPDSETNGLLSPSFCIWSRVWCCTIMRLSVTMQNEHNKALLFIQQISLAVHWVMTYKTIMNKMQQWQMSNKAPF